MRHIDRAFALFAFIALAACATSPSTPPAPSAPSASVTSGIERYMEQRAKVESVGFRLRRAAAADCTKKGRAKKDIGLVVWSLANFSNESDVEKLADTYRLTNALTVALAIEHGPAANAGITAGTIITHLNGEKIGEGRGITELFITLLNKATRSGPVTLTLEQGQEIVVRPESVCDYSTLLVRSPDINAAADGHIIAITSGLSELTQSGDEIAVILGHELAHNVLGHLDKVSVPTAKTSSILDTFVKSPISSALARAVTPPFSISKERQADIAGLYFMARAGFDVTASRSLWQKLNANLRQSNVIRTHPSGPQRLKAMDATIAEIQRKQKLRQPLDLPGQPGT